MTVEMILIYVNEGEGPLDCMTASSSCTLLFLPTDSGFSEMEN